MTGFPMVVWCSYDRFSVCVWDRGWDGPAGRHTKGQQDVLVNRPNRCLHDSCSLITHL